MDMERPSRKTKVVNYSVDDFDDEDDDFACVKAPPSKKPRESVKVHERVKSKPSSTNSSSQESDTQSLVHKNRVLVDDKVYSRDLEAALTLSLLQTAESKEEKCSNNKEVNIQPQKNDENTNPAPLRLTNCSVDCHLLGLNQITSEQRSPCAESRGQRKAASKAASKVTEHQSSTLSDEDYQPKGTPYSESDDDFSDQAASDDEEFTIKKAKTNNRKEKTAKKEKTKQPQVSKKEKQPSPKQLKPAKTKQQLPANPTVVRSPVVAKPAPVQKRPPSTPPTPRPAASASPSPAGGRIPKWNPPARIGRSPVPSQSVSVRSPGLGLRLGLSRRMRVKPLHPSVAVHLTD